MPSTEPCCRLCGCTQHDACIDDERGPCGWAAPGLCTHCADSIALLEELVTGISPTDRIETGFGDEVGEVALPMHHAEQLLRIPRRALPAASSPAGITVPLTQSDKDRMLAVETDLDGGSY